MEEKVLEILMKGALNVDDGFGGSYNVLMTEDLGDEVKDITSLFTAFMQWLRENCGIHYRVDSKLQVRWAWYILSDVNDWDGEPSEVYEDSEIFQYWLDNIYNK